MTSIVVILINFIAIRKFYRKDNATAMNDTNRIRIMNEAMTEAINEAINDNEIHDENSAIAFPLPFSPSIDAINGALNEDKTDNES